MTNLKKIGLFSFLLICQSLFANPQPSEVLHVNRLEPDKMKSDPMVYFMDWFHEASNTLGERDAAAFILATVNNKCQPSTRTMMAKEINKDGFSFIGNLKTQKFEYLRKNNNAAITFNWLQDQRQINLTGTVEPLTAKELEKIFKDRAPPHQISSVLFGEIDKNTTFTKLLKRHQALSQTYQNKPIPVPKTWGGFHFSPQKIEFWQRGPYNLHSRVVYTKDSKNLWKKIEIIS